MKTHAETQQTSCRTSCRTAALLGGLVLALTVPGTGLKAQVPEILKGALISWPDSEQEQIVVGSDSPTGPVWTPWPEPIFKRFGQVCMAVPTTASQQYFKLVSGRQFADCFSDCWGPFTNRNSYMDWFKQAGEEWLVTNGVLRLSAVQSAAAGFLLLPLGTNLEARLRDFYTSVDILDWATSTNNWTYLSLMGRGVIYSPSAGNGYMGELMFNNGGIAGTATLCIWDGQNQVFGPSFDCVAIPPPYRLEFSGVGNNLRLRVLNRTTQALIEEETLVSTRFAEGLVGIWVNTRNQANDTFAITADNFFMSGTKP